MSVEWLNSKLLADDGCGRRIGGGAGTTDDHVVVTHRHRLDLLIHFISSTPTPSTRLDRTSYPAGSLVRARWLTRCAGMLRFPFLSSFPFFLPFPLSLPCPLPPARCPLLPTLLWALFVHCE
jgi:hypothetical protein